MKKLLLLCILFCPGILFGQTLLYKADKSTTLTINGITYDLSTNRTWSVGSSVSDSMVVMPWGDTLYTRRILVTKRYIDSLHIATGDLQAVTDLGNSTTNSIMTYNSGDGSNVTIAPNLVRFQNNIGKTVFIKYSDASTRSGSYFYVPNRAVNDTFIVRGDSTIFATPYYVSIHGGSTYTLDTAFVNTLIEDTANKLFRKIDSNTFGHAVTLNALIDTSNLKQKNTDTLTWDATVSRVNNLQIKLDTFLISGSFDRFGLVILNTDTVGTSIKTALTAVSWVVEDEMNTITTANATVKINYVDVIGIGTAIQLTGGILASGNCTSWTTTSFQVGQRITFGFTGTLTGMIKGKVTIKCIKQ